MFAPRPTGHQTFPYGAFTGEPRGPCMASRPFPPTCPSCALSPNSAVTARPFCFLLLLSSSCPWPFKRFFLNRPGLEGRKSCKVSAGSGGEKSEAQRAAWGGGRRRQLASGRAEILVGLSSQRPGRLQRGEEVQELRWAGEKALRASPPRGLQKAVMQARLPGRNQPPSLRLIPF